ncbi:MAG: hypothetical protein Q8M09_13920 [Pseudomonadota bacterium]|nr:hypothetical protein [Pseudomonadota bacterium]MDP1905325.1 hypothetical protein [Pseudomonadota bacterium]
MMSLSELFVSLGAPLSNVRWSWGAVRSEDGAVFLRVWDDQKITLGERRYIRVTAYEHFKDKPGDLGWNERLQHVERIKNGAKSYMVLCFAVDVNVAPRAIKTYTKRVLLVGGALIEYRDDVWLEMTSTILTEDVVIKNK